MLGQMAAVLLMGTLAAGWLGGCLQMSARLHDEIEAGQDVIVFVPGFKGSELSWRDTSKPLWITSSEALWGHQSLILRGARFGLEAGPNLKPTGILLTVP